MSIDTLPSLISGNVTETSQKDNIDRQLPVIIQHAAKPRIAIGERVKSRLQYVPRHLRRSISAAKLAGFPKRVKEFMKMDLLMMLITSFWYVLQGLVCFWYAFITCIVFGMFLR